MRAHEFINGLLTENFSVPDHMSTDEYLTIIEHYLSGKTLLESVGTSDIEFLDSISENLDMPELGKKYSVVYIMLLQAGKPPVYLDHFNSAKVINISEDLPHVYLFEEDDGTRHTWPESRLSDTSYSKLLIFSAQEQFDKVNMFMILKYGKPMPPVQFK